MKACVARWHDRVGIVMLLDDRVSRLLHGIYGAAVAPDLWPVVLKDLAQLTHARMTSLLSHQPEGRDRVLANFNLDPTWAASYEQHFYKINIYSKKVRPLLREGLVAPHELYSSDADIMRSEYYNDFQQKLGFLRNMSGVISAREDTFMLLSVTRAPSQRRFSDSDVRLMEFLLPHVRRSTDIQDRIARLEARRATVPTPQDCVVGLGLTKAEATFVSLLAAGLSIEQICSQLQIRLTTARTHLRHLYEKTNTKRQAELVSHVLRECGRGSHDPGAE